LKKEKQDFEKHILFSINANDAIRLRTFMVRGSG
jgi:hypothetical protein